MARNSRAWVTFVTGDESVIMKALILAGSLKRVCTAHKTIVFVSPTVGKDLSDQLMEAFDMVIPLTGLSSDLEVVEEALVRALAMKMFKKCIFLSPHFMFLKNCDDLHEKFTSFGVNACDDDKGQAEIIGFVPSLVQSKSLRDTLELKKENGNKGFSHRKLMTWAQNNFADIHQFDEKYNVKVIPSKRLEPDAAIVSFGAESPKDIINLIDQGMCLSTSVIESEAVEILRLIFAQITESTLPLQSQFLTHSGSGEPIAVVGMSCRLPGANNLEEFWNILFNGENAVKSVPSYRWLRNQSLIPSKNRNVQAGFLNTPIDEFDCKFFGISPREAELLDPQQRLLHEVTWEAMEDALIDPLKLKGTRTGFFVGTWIYDYKEIALRVPDFDFYRAYMGNSVAASAARLSHFFETTGPSIGTESGCSSSIAAVHMACKSLQNGESNLAIAGGANLIIHPFENSNLGFILAPDGRCKTFDSKADGFARAEGVCSVVLKRLSDAVQDGDNIWGLIKGSALVQEGPSRSMGTPTVRCEALAMELALKDAGVKAEQISFVEAHGTGTPVGDPMEIAAIAKVYGGRKQPLLIGSVKTNIGHTEAVSGLAGLIKVLLAMKDEIIPAHLNFQEINPDIDLDSVPAQIPLSPVGWKKSPNIPRLCGVSSFGISGTDGHLIVQEPPAKIAEKSTKKKLERPLHILKLSAKCKESLEILIEKYESILKDSPLEFRDIAHTANIGRAEFSHRACITAGNSLEALTIIKENRYKITDRSGSGNQKLCFLFTGQGSQYPGMAKQLYETSPVFQSHFLQCCTTIKEFCGIDLHQIIMDPNSTAGLINNTLYSQTSIFVVEYCLLKLWESWGIKPDYVLGHSLGEFAAAVAVGALDLRTALELVAKRSILIDSLPEGKMVVVKANARIVSNMMNDFKVVHPNLLLDVAAINSQEQTVLAGDIENVLEFSKYCETKGVKSVLLATTHAFHSRQMEPILEEYSKTASSAIEKLSSKNAIKTDCQYISGVEGKIVEINTLLDKDYWRKHCREKVNFLNACKTAQKEEICLFLEIGPHPILSALVMSNMEGRSVTCIPSIRKTEENWNTMLGSLEKLWVSEWQGTIDWKGYDKYYNREKVTLPFYPFIKRTIWAEMQPHSDWPLTPLLGSVVCSPSNVVLFNNYITLKRFSYLPDHTILNKIVFPAAAFLEICLCGGHAAAQGFLEDFMKPHRPVGLKDLQIVAPFGVNENSASKVQTVVKMETEEETGTTVYKAEVHHWLEEQDGSKGGKWILHAKSSFLPVIPGSQLAVNINLDEIRNGLASKEWNVQEIYEATPELGLRFGPTFQTLKKGWGGENEEGGLFEVKLSLGQTGEYLIHPVIGDAMIQATMIWRRKLTGEGKKKRLQVPVKIGEFVWFPTENVGETEDLFIYCRADDDNSGNITAVLLSTEGKLLGRMSGVEFIDTTAKLVLGMIQQQSVHMPNIWEEVLRENPGPIESSIPSEIWEKAPRLPDDEDDWMDSGRPGEHAMLEFNHISKLATVQILKALLDLGWAPNLREKFSTEKIVSGFKIKEIFRKYIDFFFNQMTGEKLLSKGVEEGEEYVVEQGLLAEISQIDTILSKVVTSQEPSRCDYRMVSEIGRSLADILIGKVDPLTLVFPEDPTKPTAQGIYDLVASEVEPAYRRANHVLAESFPMIKANSSSNVLKMLEIGGGTGMNTRIVFDSLLPALTEQNLKLEYVFTDISPAFFTLARKNLEEYLGNIDIKFKKLDIEGDPFSQGFCPEYFDVILAAEVLHATKDIRETVRNIEKLVKPSGSVQIVETVMDDPIIMFIFGLLDGYWRFKDFDLRTKSPVLTGEKWTMILEQEGFTEVKWLPTWNGMHAGIYGYRQATPLKVVEEQNCAQVWLIFGDELTQNFAQTLELRMRQIGKNPMFIKRPSGIITEVEMKIFMKEKLKLAASKGVEFEGILYLWGMVSEDEHDQTLISLPLVSLYQELLSSASPPKVFIVTYGNDNPSESTLLGMSKSIVVEHNNSRGGKMCLERGEQLNTQVEQVFSNLWNFSNVIEYFEFKGGKRLVKRLKTRKLLNNELSLPTASSERFQLVIPSTRQISDLEFTHLDPYEIERDQVEVRVKAMALNFRDIFSVLKPIPAFDDINTIGLDFSGVVTQVGPLVEGFKPGDFVICTNFDKNLALPSHVKVREGGVAKLPEGMTFCEGATLPTAFMTAIYCLIDTGRLAEGETILIHAASGGVGLAAIQLAKEVKANIIATAGSDRKRAYLRSIGVTHVFNSRTTEFSQQILDVTNGKGVDIVLNSLTGPGFKEATLQALGKGGRFIEMSKLQVWEKEEVAEIRPDVEYHVVDLSVLEVETFKTILDNIRGRIEDKSKKSIQPLPYDRFDALDIRAALHHLQQAKHIGKVVCVMPETIRENSKVKIRVPLFNDRSTYIVTGGLGGIGFEVVKWMLKNGAKYIAIVSRSVEPKLEIAGQIKKLNDDGKHVQHFSLDVSDFKKCCELFETIQNPCSEFPKIRGVMHAAGILDDATFENQNWEKFNSTYKTKVEGSWNLHLLTKSLNLEHFVMFSSIASVLGAPGQANYSASNSFQDALAHFRNSQGLPATTINWGNWGEVGIATEVDFPGVRPISTSQGLLLLSSVLKAPKATQLTAANIDSFSLLSQLIPNVKQYMDDASLFGVQKTQLAAISSDEFWAEVDAAPDREGKYEVFKKHIKIFVRNLLKMEVDEPISDTVDFQSLGIDSLMMLEMKNSLQNVLGSRLIITASQLRDCNNVQLLANRFLDIIESKEEEALMPTLEELRVLIREDCRLLDEVILEPVQVPVKKESEIQTVFVTGVTGTLGGYILKDICRIPTIQKIYCLVRPRGNLNASERLKEIMNKRGVEETSIEVVAIEGDVGKDYFGVNEEVYEKLALEIDAVIHCAAKSDHIAKYWKAPATRLANIRNVNVLGTKRVLEFASRLKTKYVFYASALVITTTVNEDNTLSEDWQGDNAFESVSYNSGYAISKFISEQLVKQAWEQGIPCKSFRFALVTGDGKTGELDILSSHYMIRLLAFMKLGCMPDSPLPSLLITPDVCSQALAHLCFNDTASPGVYNVLPPHPQMEQVFVDVAKEFGVQIEIVSVEDFLQKLRMEGDDSPIAPLKRMYTDADNSSLEIAQNISSINHWMENSSEEFFISKKLIELMPPGFLEAMEPAAEIMRRDIRYAKRSGAFEMVGIKLAEK